MQAFRKLVNCIGLGAMFIFISSASLAAVPIGDYVNDNLPRKLRGTITNSAGASVSAAQIKFFIPANVNNKTVTIGIQSDNYMYMWKEDPAGFTHLCTAVLQNSSGSAVSGSLLKFAINADLDGNGNEYLIGFQKDTSWVYAWKISNCLTSNTLQPVYQGYIYNSTAANKVLVPVNSLTSVSSTYYAATSSEIVTAVQGANVWSYAWTMNPSPTVVVTQSGVYHKNVQPKLIANYFIQSSGLPNVSGAAYNYAPTHPSLGHQGTLVTNQPDSPYYTSTTNGHFISFGPYVTEPALRALVNKAGAVSYKVEYELKVSSNAPSSTPVGMVDIVSSLAVKQTHTLFPQDFTSANTFQKFSFVMPYYQAYPNADTTQPSGTLEFRVQTTTHQNLSVRNITITPLDFATAFGGWTYAPWKGGALAPEDEVYRIFDPNWILTTDFNKITLAPTPLANIDRSKRDILVGHKGTYPYIGAYDQGNDDLLRYHISQAMAAGLDAFKVYVYFPTGANQCPGTLQANGTVSCGTCNATQESEYNKAIAPFQRLLTIAGQKGFKVFIDDSTLSQVLYTAPSLSQFAARNYGPAICNMKKLASTVFNQAGYFKMNNKPVYGVPVMHESDPAKLSAFLTAFQANYSGGLHTLVTAMTTWPDSSDLTNANGPYNMQANYFDHNLSSTTTTNPNFYIFQNWQKYFTCPSTPATMDALLNNCTCKHQPAKLAKDVAPYCITLATMLTRSEMTSYRNISAATSLFDWAESALYPKFFYKAPGSADYVDTPASLSSDLGFQTFSEAMKRYVADSRSYGFSPTLSVTPGYDRSNFVKGSGVGIDRKDKTGDIRFWRKLRAAWAASPDMIDIENWNGWGEAVQIEPSTDYDLSGATDPNLYLKAVAGVKGESYTAPCIPTAVIDPIRLSQIPVAQRCP